MAATDVQFVNRSLKGPGAFSWPAPFRRNLCVGLFLQADFDLFRAPKPPPIGSLIDISIDEWRSTRIENRALTSIFQSGFGVEL
jgi:hypothetical protein